jgi:hypothetical protein
MRAYQERARAARPVSTYMQSPETLLHVRPAFSQSLFVVW